MLTLLTVIFIHPCGEIAQGPDSVAVPTQKPSNQTFSLKGGKTIVVKKFNFSGNSGVTTPQLERLTNHYLNRTLSESNLSEIKLRIEILYRSKGYSHVEITVSPMQNDETLTFMIKEGKKQA